MCCRIRTRSFACCLLSPGVLWGHELLLSSYSPRNLHVIFSGTHVCRGFHEGQPGKVGKSVVSLIAVLTIPFLVDLVLAIPCQHNPHGCRGHLYLILVRLDSGSAWRRLPSSLCAMSGLTVYLARCMNIPSPRQYGRLCTSSCLCKHSCCPMIVP